MPTYPVEFPSTLGIVWGYQYRMGDVIDELDPVCVQLRAEIEQEGAIQIRPYTDTPGPWGPVIPVPEPSVGLSAILLFGVLLLSRGARSCLTKDSVSLRSRL